MNDESVIIEVRDYVVHAYIEGRSEDTQSIALVETFFRRYPAVPHEVLLQWIIAGHRAAGEIMNVADLMRANPGMSIDKATMELGYTLPEGGEPCDV